MSPAVSGRGYIAVVCKRGKWLSWKNVPVAKVPNFFVFLALVDSIIGVNQVG